MYSPACGGGSTVDYAGSMRSFTCEGCSRGASFRSAGSGRGAAAVLAPILPTMAVLGLMLVSCFSLLLLVMERRELELFYTPYNRYIWMYAAIYLVGTWFSVTRSGSLLGGCLTVAFTLFALVLENSITTQRQLGQSADAHGNWPVRRWLCTVCASTCSAGATSRRPGWTAICSAMFPGALYFREPQHAGGNT